jgi:hypothetical protein
MGGAFVMSDPFVLHQHAPELRRLKEAGYQFRIVSCDLDDRLVMGLIATRGGVEIASAIFDDGDDLPSDDPASLSFGAACRRIEDQITQRERDRKS